ncbi:Ca2+/Na+ antiporter [Halanaerobacter jeridensis]|uniref:Ca2+/Na+ antiporter n=1 Tax=Halanaerobacter jeridensis TaxID=706427 RepID=A0A938XRB0_9FIRM|nr:Ca2+/Na+ antiporter [Halanaerobacter jeridensis]
MEFLTSNITFALHMLFVITVVMNITLESLGFEVNIFKIITILLLVLCFFVLLVIKSHLNNLYWFYLIVEIYIFFDNIYYFIQYQKK